MFHWYASNEACIRELVLSTLIDFMDLVTFSLKKQNQPRWELCTPLFVLHDFMFFSFSYGQMKKKIKISNTDRIMHIITYLWIW